MTDLHVLTQLEEKISNTNPFLMVLQNSCILGNADVQGVSR